MKDRELMIQNYSESVAKLMLKQKGSMRGLEVSLITIIKGIEMLLLVFEKDEKEARKVIEDAISLCVKSIEVWGDENE